MNPPPKEGYRNGRRPLPRQALRVLVLTVATSLLVILSPAAAFADCSISYRDGTAGGGCGGAAPIVAVAAVGGAAAVAAITLAALSYLRGRMSEADLTALLTGGTTQSLLTTVAAPPGVRPPGAVAWARPATGVVGGAPDGPRTVIGERQDQNVRRSLERENECAAILAARGYEIHQNPDHRQTAAARAQTGDSGDPEKEPDYLMEGHVFDCYAPGPSKPVRGIWAEVRDKVVDKQTQRVILNLHDWRGDLSALQKQFDEWPIDRLREAVALTPSGAIVQIAGGSS